MSRLSYMLHPKDRGRVCDLLTRLVPARSEKEALRILARCSNWTAERMLGVWPEGMTISADPREERAWRDSNVKDAYDIRGLAPLGEDDRPSLVDLLISGLFLHDKTGERMPEVSRMTTAFYHLAGQVSPARAVISSSLGRKGVASLCGKEKAFVMSPQNQLDLLHKEQRDQRRDVFPWIVMKGYLDQPVCRSLWRAVAEGNNLAEAAGFEVMEFHEVDEVISTLRGRMPVLLDQQDYRDLTGRSAAFIDTIFLSNFTRGDWCSSELEIQRQKTVKTATAADFAHPTMGTSSRQMAQVFLKAVMAAVRNESVWHPPGSLARALNYRHRLPDLCGPELTN